MTSVPRKSVAFVGVFTALTLAVPAAAQIDPLDPSLQTGTRFKQEPESLDSAKVRALQKDIARCIAYRHKEETRLLLANSDMVAIDYTALPFDAENFTDELDVVQCLERAMKQSQATMQIRFQHQTLRNLLGEEVYLMDRRGPPAIAPGEPEMLGVRSFEASGGHPRAVGMAKLADCIVYHGAAEADALLDTRPGTDEEREALGAVLPALSKCVGEGTEITVDTGMIRMLAGDGLWARSHYSSGSVTPSAAPVETAE